MHSVYVHTCMCCMHKSAYCFSQKYVVYKHIQCVLHLLFACITLFITITVFQAFLLTSSPSSSSDEEAPEAAVRVKQKHRKHKRTEKGGKKDQVKQRKGVSNGETLK